MKTIAQYACSWVILQLMFLGSICAMIVTGSGLLGMTLLSLGEAVFFMWLQLFYLAHAAKWVKA